MEQPGPHTTAQPINPKLKRLYELGVLTINDLTNSPGDGDDANTAVRGHNVGSSDYATHLIQPWTIWKEYDLNAWDADIVKRVLRTKREQGLSAIDSRIQDYKKIVHVCNERIRQLELEAEYI